jgi:simple sugar transport system ATP-binding protein
MTPALELDGLTRRFGALLAVDHASLTIAPGEVVALVGENGAGKTTLASMAYGLVVPDAGEVRAGGRRLPAGSPRAALAAGLGMVHQHFMLVPSLTVAENLVLGAEPRRGPVVDRAAAAHAAEAISARHGLALAPGDRVEDLGVAARQRLEVAKLLYRDARVLLLDEPTALLAPAEAEALLAAVRSLAASGRSVVFVSHRLKDVLSIASRVYVMRRGRVVAERRVGETSEAELAELMVGNDLPSPWKGEGQGEGGPTSGEPSPLPASGEREHVAPTVRLRRATALSDRGAPAFRDVDLDLRPGEILAVAGVEGNGQQELAEVAAGLRPLSSGHLERASPLRRDQVAYVPADRLRDALAPGLSVEENLALGRHRRPPVARGPLVLGSGRRQEAGRLLAALDVRPPDPDLPAASLSGGNQQKLVLARELLGARPAPPLVVAVQPARGLDAAASARAAALLREARARGAAVLLVSSELDLVRALGDRIAVFARGRLVALLPRGATEQEIGRAMLVEGATATATATATASATATPTPTSTSTSTPTSTSTSTPTRRRISLPSPVPILSAALALALSLAIIQATGRDALEALSRLIDGAFGSPAALGETAVKTAVLVCTGLSVVIGFAAGLFNVGAEGQFVAGALAAAVVGARLSLPAPVHVTLALAAAALAGAAPALVAAALKVRRGVHEVISTIMLNWVVLYVVQNWLVPGPLRARTEGTFSAAGSAIIHDTAALPRLVPGSRLDLGLPLALAAALATALLLRRTVAGFEIRAAGANGRAARVAGVAVGRRVALALGLAGAAAGVGGALLVLGTEHRFPATFRTGYGFDGIVVALLGGAAPGGAVGAAAFLGALRAGATRLQLAGIHPSFAELIQGLAVLLVAARAGTRAALDRVARRRA